MGSPKQSAWLDELRAQCRRDGIEWARDLFRRYSYEEAMARIELKVSDLQQVIDHAREVRTNGG